MPYVYHGVRNLEAQPHIDGGDCVALVKALTPGLKGLATSAWRQGKRVVDTTGLLPGTAIATFENGRYPNRPTGNHAAFFVAYAGKAIWIMDQWKGDPRKPKISMRVISPGLKNKDGTFRRPSDAADNFYVIELRWFTH